MDQQSDLHGDGVSKSGMRTQKADTPVGRAAAHMGAILPQGGGRGGERETRAAGKLGVLGEEPVAAALSLSSEATSGWSHPMRPSELLTLLNSTSLGRVLSERTLYRHRRRAGRGVSRSGGVHLVRYVAWLVQQRHCPPSPADEAIGYREILRVLEGQQYRCALTGRQLTPDSAALDHILAVSRGGRHELTNIQVLHKDVNRAKSTMTNEEFVRMCREVARHADECDQEV